MEDLGARLEEVEEGIRTVADFGDPAAEHRALRRGCGLVDFGWWESVVVAGEDSRRFLNGYVTCEVAALEPGRGAYGFFTDAKGRVLADAAVAAADGDFRLLVPAGRGELLLAHLRRFVLADRVTLERADTDLVALLGPRAAEVLGTAGLPAPEALWAWAEVEGEPFRVQRIGHRGVDGYCLVGAPGRGGQWAGRLVDAGAVPAGWTALETVRVEAGEPRWRAEFDDANLPQESGLADAVSYTKGCYLGQEVVARLHYRGRAQRGLVGLEIEADGVPEHGDGLLLAGEEVGRLGSAVASLHWPGRTLGLAIVHRKAAEPGNELHIASGGAAMVRRLPWSFEGGTS